MSSSRGRGGGGTTGNAQHSSNNNNNNSIPAGCRKVVLSLKEIVSSSEAEIYAALKDCNMDPNEAVARLLSQDSFHEVKRKKEKKKEVKDSTESRGRGGNYSSNRGNKTGGADRYSGGGADRYSGGGGGDRYSGRGGGSTPYHSSESAPSYGKPAYRKENGTPSYSAAAASGTNRSGVPPAFSDSASAEVRSSVLGSADGVQPAPLPTPAYQSAWAGAPGKVSMAEIVKRGIPQNKVNSASASHNKVQGPSTTSQQVPTVDEWPSMPAVPKEVVVTDYTVKPEVHPEPPAVALDSVHQDYEEEEYQETGIDDVENSGANDGSRAESSHENDAYENTGSYQARNFDSHQVDEVGASVTSVAENFQQLNVEEEEEEEYDESPSEEDVPSVVIPDHLQVQTEECSHLSFGSFGPVVNVAHSSRSVESVPVKANLEEPEREADISSVAHQDNRNPEYYVEDSLGNVSDGSLFHRTGASAGTYDVSSDIQTDELKPENAEVSHGDQYSFPSSNQPGYSYDNSQNSNAAFSHANQEMQNLAQFSNVMHSYPNSIPSTLLAANVHPSRESELQYAQFLAKYGNPGSTMSVPEASKTAPQTQPGANVPTGPPLQHLPVHPYSQANLPLGPFANMIGYPFMPQSYTYMPSAFQQAFAGNSGYHQSLAAVLPQYKSSPSVSSLPQSATVPSGFGAFGGNNANIPGNFSGNPPAGAAPSGSNLTYEDLLSSQYKDQLLSLQQNEWMQGLNSRTMSAVPASTYYNYQTQQTQQPNAAFRQAQQQQQQQQQPSQNYGYPNMYHHSQAGGMSLDQAQNPRDASLGGAQGQPKQSQMWQNGY